MLDFSWSVHDDLCGSDHFPIVLKTNIPTSNSTARRWKLNKADWTTFRELCDQNLREDEFELATNPTELFTSKLMNIATKTIPTSSTNPRHTSKPWFNDACKEAIKTRKKALRVFSSQPSRQNLDSFKMNRAKARRTIREEKRASWQTYVSKLNCRTSVKKAWDMVRKISCKNPTTTIHHLKDTNGLITSTIDISNTLAKTFSHNSSTQQYSDKFKQFKQRKEKDPINFKSKNDENYNSNFSMRELMDSLRSAHDTATGPDDVHYQLLKHLPDSSLAILLNIFNQIWTTGNFPPAWQQAIVISLPKPGKDHSDPNNYRPIALTSCLCKTMERMVNSRLVYYLEANNLITNIQSGFRKERSTTDQLVRLETWVREGMINRQHVVAVFFDLEKAYDTAWKYGILSDLFKAGLRGHMPTFISHFLENRQFRVRVGSTLSDLYDQEMGVPQGSILSVTLFGLKINDIVKCVNPGTESSLFVDDFAACCRSKQLRSIERQLQQCLNKLQKWADENGFKFSETKTVCMHFCNLRRLHDDPLLTIDNNVIPVVKEAKFLGILFDNKLSFIPHLRNLRDKCLKALNLLRVVAHRDWGGDFLTLIKLYRCFIRSKLDYGCIVFGSARKSYIQMLDPIQNQSLRLCLGAFRTTPVESLQVEANEPPLAARRNKLALQYALKVYSNQNNPAFDSTFNPQYHQTFDRKLTAIPTFGIRVEQLLLNAGIDVDCIAAYSLTTIPPWTIQLPTVNFTLHTGNKSSIDPNTFKVKFYNVLDTYPDYTHIYTDGSKDGERVACAAVCGQSVMKCRLPDCASIFSAESQAIMLALDFIEVSQHDKFAIFSDSMSCLQAIDNAKFEDPMIKSVLEKCHFLQSNQKTIVFWWVPSHVGIRGNEKADAAAKAALDLVTSNVKIPHTDLKHIVHTHYSKKWQSDWDHVAFNKLQPIKPLLGDTTLRNISSRRDEVVLHRLRLGHSYLTHSYLLKGEDAPECVPCQCLLTVEHILLHCVDFSLIRPKHFSAQNLNQLFNTTNPCNILNFLKEINLYRHF